MFSFKSKIQHVCINYILKKCLKNILIKNINMLVKFEAVKKQRAINYITLFCSLCVRHAQIVKKGLSAAHSIFVLLRHTCETQTGEKSYP